MGTESQQGRQSSTPDCAFIETASADDPGLQLDTCLEELGGSITDVATTGQYGWLSFFTALHNKTGGLTPPTNP
ncbi:hypothetical protein GQ600_19589 [Phytophthora cactorum]|nr:hypothetical protein GQ600_19589 [Phytophthora cactorum]